MENTNGGNAIFLNAFLEIQGLMSSSIEGLGYAQIITNPKEGSYYWNYALTEVVLNRQEISVIERSLGKANRATAIYFEDSDGMIPLKDELLDNGYKVAYVDSWMFYNSDLRHDDFEGIKKVSSEDDLKIWLRTADLCFTLDDPQNPYGTLGAYLELAEETWREHNKSDRVEYFIAYKEDKAVAVATLTHQNGFGYISNLGSMKEVRGQGYGKRITFYCINQSKLKGNKEHFLATEDGTYPNEFYRRIGFKTRFRAVCYSKI